MLPDRVHGGRADRYRQFMAAAVTEATITCPECGAETREDMPTNACQFFYTCPACSARLRPLAGDCCVFCSYADQVCPPKQTGNDACC
jgi:predicted nucleic acid-binding Zn ribbon protein